jgi:DNA replication protein DnaC
VEEVTDEEQARRQKAWEERQEEQRQRARALRLDSFLKLCPERFQETSRDYRDPDPAMPCVDWAAFDRVQAYEFGKKGLLLAGATGLGKSRAMWTLLKRLWVDGSKAVRGGYPGETSPLRVVAFESYDFGNTAVSLLEQGRGKFSDWIGDLSRADVVFLDDFGKLKLVGSRDEWVRSEIFGLVDARHARNRPTFYTTNLTAEKFMQHASGDSGEPLLRRVVETCDIVKFGASQ